MQKECKELLAGTFEITLTNCELRQRGTPTPIVYTGPGLITQDKNQNLYLRLFAEGIGIDEALSRQFRRSNTPGRLIPETEYFDFRGIDQTGSTWTAEYLPIDPDFGTSTYIKASPRRIEKSEEANNKTAIPTVIAFVPHMIELPWHATTKYGEHSYSMDRFEHTLEQFSWVVRKNDGGTWMTFKTRVGAAEQRFIEFLRAFSIMSGRSIQPLALVITESSVTTTRFISRFSELDDARLLSPIPMTRPRFDDAHRFLERFLLHASNFDSTKKAHSKRIHQLWHRILRARENDIENSSLVLSIAIEGLINKALISKKDVDPEFLAQVKHARPIIKKSGLQARARDCVLSSLGNATRPKVQNVLRRFISEALIREDHLKGWQDMRHAAAHGSELLSEEGALQAHIDRFHICLDLFYRLVFIIIGFKGTHQDLSSEGWPAQNFPPEPLNSSNAIST